MTTTSNILKTAAVAGLIGLGLAATTSSPASARTYSRCDSDGCYRVSCDWRGYCYRTSRDYYRRSYYAPSYYAPSYGPSYGEGYYRSVRVCDRWGCHWVRRYEPRTHVEFGVRF